MRSVRELVAERLLTRADGQWLIEQARLTPVRGEAAGT
jgi:hypothetical protein